MKRKLGRIHWGKGGKFKRMNEVRKRHGARPLTRRQHRELKFKRMNEARKRHGAPPLTRQQYRELQRRVGPTKLVFYGRRRK